MARSNNITVTKGPIPFLCEGEEREQATEVRKAVLDGYNDVLHGRTHEYTGDLREMLKTLRSEPKTS
jgi:hypothetical protein